MKKENDLQNMKSRKDPYAKHLKKQITIRMPSLSPSSHTLDGTPPSCRTRPTIGHPSVTGPLD